MWLDRDHIQGFISGHIRGLRRMYNVCGVKDERPWDLLYDIICLDTVMTRQFSHCKGMWNHCKNRSSFYREWWEAFRSYIGQMFHKTHDQMNNWRWDNPLAFGYQVDCSIPQTTSSGKVKHTGERVSWYSSDDFRVKGEPPSCRQHKPGDFLAVRPLNWDEIIEEDDDDENWAHPGAPSSGRTRPGDGNDNDDGVGEEDMRASETGTSNGKGTMDGEGRRKSTEDWKWKGRASGRQ